jgi:uncharacterized damage-inducible protein DinB
MSEPEPWLRGTLTDIPPVQRAVLHALELAREDLYRWCATLDDEQLNARLFGLPSIAFHIRHISRSIDRLLTYAEGMPLSAAQLAELETELNMAATRDVLFHELAWSLDRAFERIRAFRAESLDQPRSVGKKQLPATVAGLLVHIADHTLRHVGQAITTSKIISSQITQV